MPLIGHAIEVRLYAEDPDNDFLPATGTLALYREADAGPGRRVDSGVSEGDEVSPFYDPMLGKLIAWGEKPRRGTPAPAGHAQRNLRGRR